MSEEKELNKQEKESGDKNVKNNKSEQNSKKNDEKSKDSMCPDGSCNISEQSKNYIIFGVLIMLIGITMFMLMKNKDEEEVEYKEVSEQLYQEISTKLQTAFDDTLAPGQGTEIKSITEDKYLYKIEIDVAGNEFTVYLTKDQQKLIPQIVEMGELLGEEVSDEEAEANTAKLTEENKKVLGITADSKPQVDYFVMSFCPYGNPADENASQISQLFGDSVNVVPHYILNTDPKAPNGYNSLHGPQEAHQGVRELCVLNEYGQDAFFKFTLESNNVLNSKNADTEWQKIAVAQGLNVDRITACTQNDGLAIAQSEINVTTNAKSEGRNGVSSIGASPTVLVNGETVPSSATAIQEALCESFPEGEKPAACDANIDEATAAEGSC